MKFAAQSPRPSLGLNMPPRPLSRDKEAHRRWQTLISPQSMFGQTGTQRDEQELAMSGEGTDLGGELGGAHNDRSKNLPLFGGGDFFEPDIYPEIPSATP